MVSWELVGQHFLRFMCFIPYKFLFFSLQINWSLFLNIINVLSKSKCIFCIPTRSRYNVLVNTDWQNFQELEYNEIWLMQNLSKFNDPWVNCYSFYNLKYFMFFRNFRSCSLLEITCWSLCQILQDDILNTILSFF